MFRYSNYQGPDLYSSGSGRWVYVYTGNPNSDQSQNLGYVDSNGNVYKGKPGSDRSIRLGYIDGAGIVRKGSPASDYSSTVGHVLRFGSILKVFQGSPNTDHATQVGNVFGGAIDKKAEKDVLHFCGACLLFSLIEKAEREMAVCPNCGVRRHPHDPIEFRFCSYCGYLYPPM